MTASWVSNLWTRSSASTRAPSGGRPAPTPPPIRASSTRSGTSLPPPRTRSSYYAKKTSAIVAISDIQKQELSEVYKIAPAEKFRVIPLGFDLNRFQENKAMKRDAFRKQYDIADDEIAVSIVGRLVPVKNHTMFIDSIKQVKASTNRKVRGIIVGDGDLHNSLIEYAKSHGLTCSTPENKVPNSDLIFTSWIKDADYVFAGSEISALTSLNEGTPVSIIESQAANVPVVSTIVGGIRDVVIEGKTALLSPTQNVDAFSQNLLNLVNNDELRRQTKFILEKDTRLFHKKLIPAPTLPNRQLKGKANVYIILSS